MLYQQKTFSCPAAPTNLPDRNWDRAFLNREEFEAKYGAGSYDEAQPYGPSNS
jgi:hypothetical protein